MPARRAISRPAKDQVGRCVGPPRDKLLCLFDVFASWFAEASFRGCLFINAAAEFRGVSAAIFAQTAEHKRLIAGYVRDLAGSAGAPNTDIVADQIVLLLGGANVTAQVSGGTASAARARDAAAILLDHDIASAQPVGSGDGISVGPAPA